MSFLKFLRDISLAISSLFFLFLLFGLIDILGKKYNRKIDLGL